MATTRWGILGCGRIAGKFASDLALVPDAELVALGSRSIENARAFASQYPAKYLHNSYEALAANPEVDVIYIASPHALHHQHSLLCLAQHKAVLCEKAFALNLRQAREMIDFAQSRQVFLMEALWTRFLPHFNKVLEWVALGQLGELRSIQANFGFKPFAPVPERLYNPALGGGSLLDIGIYTVFLATTLLGRPDKVNATQLPYPTGVDEQCAITLEYASGCIAQLLSSFASHLPTEAMIAGTNGRIQLTHRFYEPSARVEFYPNKPDSREVLEVPAETGWGYHHQIKHVQDCLRAGLTESPLMKHADTLLLMETLDRIRAAAGIKYAADQ